MRFVRPKGFFIKEIESNLLLKLPLKKNTSFASRLEIAYFSAVVHVARQRRLTASFGGDTIRREYCGYNTYHHCTYWSGEKRFTKTGYLSIIEEIHAIAEQIFSALPRSIKNVRTAQHNLAVSEDQVRELLNGRNPFQQTYIRSSGD